MKKHLYLFLLVITTYLNIFAMEIRGGGSELPSEAVAPEGFVEVLIDGMVGFAPLEIVVQNPGVYQRVSQQSESRRQPSIPMPRPNQISAMTPQENRVVLPARGILIQSCDHRERRDGIVLRLTFSMFDSTTGNLKMRPADSFDHANSVNLLQILPNQEGELFLHRYVYNGEANSFYDEDTGNFVVERLFVCLRAEERAFLKKFRSFLREQRSQIPGERQRARVRPRLSKFQKNCRAAICVREEFCGGRLLSRSFRHLNRLHTCLGFVLLLSRDKALQMYVDERKNDSGIPLHYYQSSGEGPRRGANGVVSPQCAWVMFFCEEGVCEQEAALFSRWEGDDRRWRWKIHKESDHSCRRESRIHCSPVNSIGHKSYWFEVGPPEYFSNSNFPVEQCIVAHFVKDEQQRSSSLLYRYKFSANGQLLFTDEMAPNGVDEEIAVQGFFCVCACPGCDAEVFVVPRGWVDFRFYLTKESHSCRGSFEQIGSNYVLQVKTDRFGNKTTKPIHLFSCVHNGAEGERSFRCTGRGCQAAVVSYADGRYRCPNEQQHFCNTLK